MKEIAISKFRSKCCAILEQVRKTRKPIRVTRYGKPFVDVVPPSIGRKSSRDKVVR